MNASTVSTNGVHHAADEAIDALYSWIAPPTPPPQPCPEAAFSITLKGKLGGHETLLTARGQTPEEFKRNLEAIRGPLDPVPGPTVPQGQPQGPGKDWCQVHQTAMPLTTKNGRSWHSHRTADGWCKGR